MKPFSKFIYTSGISLIFMTSSIYASDAFDIAKRAYEYLDTQKSYYFDAVVVSHYDNQKNSHNISVKVSQPDKMRIDIKGGIKDRSLYLKDGIYTMIDNRLNYYGQIDTGEGIDKTLDYIFERFNIKAPLAQLIYSHMHNRAKFSKSKYFGIVSLQGVKCHYIAFSDKTKEVHVWIESGDKPLIKHYVIIDKTDTQNIQKQTTIFWKDSNKIKDSDFIFKIPNDAQNITIESTK